MNCFNRIILSIMGMVLLILSSGLPCHASPVGVTQSCVTQGPAFCNTAANFGFVTASADAEPPGGTSLPSIAVAFAGADDTLTFLGSGHAFVQFQFVVVTFPFSSGDATASVDGQDVSGFGTVDSSLFPITFGVPFTFDLSVGAIADDSGALIGQDAFSEADLQLTDILVVNAGGHPLRNIHLTSGSGTLYPLDAANTLPSPEPPSLSLLGFGLIALLFAASRKRFLL